MGPQRVLSSTRSIEPNGPFEALMNACVVASANSLQTRTSIGLPSPPWQGSSHTLRPPKATLGPASVQKPSASEVLKGFGRHNSGGQGVLQAEEERAALMHLWGALGLQDAHGVPKTNVPINKPPMRVLENEIVGAPGP